MKRLVAVNLDDNEEFRAHTEKFLRAFRLLEVCEISLRAINLRERRRTLASSLLDVDAMDSAKNRMALNTEQVYIDR